ncbi:MAG: hypothetical protein CMH70_09260 [Nitrosomonadaceae bacterium]|nr:hypothetical protein [Nitrosomonadaceae bacterium]|tara:strand:- start:414 stop:791 length:378 start_codon:yes stop_codon:yes gene_type:complete
MSENNKLSNSRWDKSPRFRIFIHLLAGFCFLATVDNSGLTKLIAQSLNFTQSEEITSPIISMMISAIIIVAGYFVSLKITSIVDQSSLKADYKSWIIFSLPIAYFSVVFPLVFAIQSLINPFIIK